MWDCPFTRSIWLWVTSLFDLSIPMLGCFNDLCLRVMRVRFSDQLDFLWRAAFMTFTCSIWHLRNQFLFDGIPPTFEASVILIHTLIRESASLDEGCMANTCSDLLRLRALGVPGRRRRAPQIMEALTRPLFGWFQVNRDGFWRARPLCCCRPFSGSQGGQRLFFPMRCRLLRRSSRRLCLLSSGRPRWVGQKYGSLSRYVVDLFTQRSLDVPWKLLGRWRATLHYISGMDFMLSHIFREGNHVADRLSKMDSFSLWWETPPQEITQNLLQDYVGSVSYPFVDEL